MPFGSEEKKMYEEHLKIEQAKNPDVDLILDIGSGDMGPNGEDWREVIHPRRAPKRRKGRS